MPRIHYYKPKNKNLPLFRKKIKSLLKIGGFILLFIFIFGLIVFAYFAKDLPDPYEEIGSRKIIQSTKIYDRTGETILYDIHGEEKRTVIPYDKIPQYVKDATIAAEDSDFWSHKGLDFKSILRAAWQNLKGQRISQGGSTITQQFVKNSLLSPERTFTRKIKEAVLSIELERKYSKEEILGFYLNQIPYGSNSYGIEAAAQTFFGKNAENLTLAESALLSSLPKAPSYYSPYSSRTDELKTRKDYVLDRMLNFGYISKEENKSAKKEEIKLNPPSYGIKAPHFVMYIKEYLEQKYGEKYVRDGGLKVYTTLDWNLQQIAEEAVKNGAEENTKRYNAKNAALVALDPKTGQILAMVGSRDYFDIKNDGNVNVTIRDRQPGSSFKPFAYSIALQKGYTADTIVFDVPTEFNPNCSTDGSQEKDQYGLDCYHPKNYDEKFRGPVTFREALAQSLNVPSVKVLYLASVNETINLAQNMGITTLKNRERFGLSLVLGGGEVKLLDETAAYGVFANEGIKNEKTAILKIEDPSGNILEKYNPQPLRVLDAQITRTISDILSDNNARAPIFGVASSLLLAARPAAAKTGTTQEFRDGWTIGYTPSLVAGVWVGNNDNSKMHKASGSIGAAPIWNEFMTNAYKIKTLTNAEKNIQKQTENQFTLPQEIEYFIKPELVATEKPILNGNFEKEETVKIDKISGLLATQFTPPDLVEKKVFKEVHSLLYYVDKNNPQGEYSQNPSQDPQFKNWEESVLNWASQFNNGNNIYNQKPPIEYDNIHTAENQPKIEIIYPKDGDRVSNYIRTDIEAEAPLKIKQIDLFIDNIFIGTDFTSPYAIESPIPQEILMSEEKFHTLTVKAYDIVGNRSQKDITVVTK